MPGEPLKTYQKQLNSIIPVPLVLIGSRIIGSRINGSCISGAMTWCEYGCEGESEGKDNSEGEGESEVEVKIDPRSVDPQT